MRVNDRVKNRLYPGQGKTLRSEGLIGVMSGRENIPDTGTPWRKSLRSGRRTEI